MPDLRGIRPPACSWCSGGPASILGRYPNSRDHVFLGGLPGQVGGRARHQARELRLPAFPASPSAVYLPVMPPGDDQVLASAGP